MKIPFWEKCFRPGQVLFLILLVVIPGFGLAQPITHQHTLMVIIKNVKNENGQVHVALYNSSQNFLKKFWRGETVDAKSGELVVKFLNVPSGNYAVGVIHDENKNQRLDTNFFGIPAEGYGFSNDARGFLGAPGFDKAMISIRTDLKIEITMKYF